MIAGIDGLDADVTTIEAARSRMEVLADLARVGFRRGIGPGVYDIHSPRVPSRDEIDGLLDAALTSIPARAALGEPGLRPEDQGLRRGRARPPQPGRGRPPAALTPDPFIGPL